MQAGLMKGRRPRFVFWSGRSPGEGNGNPLQYSCLENPMDRGAWQAMVHGIARVGQDLATKPQPPELINQQGNFFSCTVERVAAFSSPLSLCAWDHVGLGSLSAFCKCVLSVRQEEGMWERLGETPFLPLPRH